MTGPPNPSGENPLAQAWVHDVAPLDIFARLPYYPWLVVGVTCVGAFMGQVDASIVQLALPALRREFHASLAAVSWVAIAYLLAYASTLPVFARLSKVFGRKLLYAIGFVVFAVASALCGATSHLSLLIAFRLLQGVGGGLLGSNSMSILQASAPSGKRGTAMGLYAAAQAVGISVGPIVGGVLLAGFGWRWIFWVTVPFSIAGCILTWWIVPQTKEYVHYKHFDWRGVLALVPALTLIVVLLSQLASLGFESTALIGGAFIVAVLLLLFAWMEHREPEPLIDLRLFQLPAFAGGLIAVNLSYALLYSVLFLMSFACIRGLNESPIVAGLHLSIFPIALGLVAPLSGNLYERVGRRLVTIAGMAVCVAAVIVMLLSLSSTGHGSFRMLALALFGIGLGAFIAPNNAATMTAVADNRRSEAGGLINLMRALGCAIGVATASTALSWRMEMLTMLGNKTGEGPSQTVLTAVGDALWVPAAFAILAAIAASFQNRDPLEVDASPRISARDPLVGTTNG
jgi:EmrB/QacA subfamily drug resistance transporter